MPVLFVALKTSNRVDLLKMSKYIRLQISSALRYNNFPDYEDKYPLKTFQFLRAEYVFFFFFFFFLCMYYLYVHSGVDENVLYSFDEISFSNFVSKFFFSTFTFALKQCWDFEIKIETAQT